MIKKILKGLLLWVATFTVAIFIMGAESLYDNGYFIHGLLVCAIICYLGYKYISDEEFEYLSGSMWINKKLSNFLGN